ncbi:7-carboxy-7-deazaguanine synthase QueE [Kaarinaea lacus]
MQKPVVMASNSSIDDASSGERPLNAIRITEIFLSLQGESRSVGYPTVFVRLTGCPLRCQYCDTAYAFTGGEWLSMQSVLDEVASYETEYVTVTGGEPLAQKQCLSLLAQLCDKGYQVSLETSGALSVDEVDSRVVKVMDFKTPASGEVDRNLFENVKFLTVNDQVKFVICDQQDYEWAKAIIEEYKLLDKCEVLMSPSYTQLKGVQLAEWILNDRLPVRFQLQLHKILWGDQPGR